MTMTRQLFPAEGGVRPGRPYGRPGRAGVLAGVACALITLLLVTAAVLVSARTGLSTSIAMPVSAAACGVLGGLLLAAKPRHVVSWAFALTGVLFGLGLFAEQYASYGLVTSPGSLPGAEVALWVLTWVWQPALILMFAIMPLYFPDGRPPSARWRWAARAAVALIVITVALTAVVPAEIRLGDARLPNPFGVEAVRPLSVLTQAGLGLLWLALVFVAVTSLLVRFRRAGDEQRAQIKWLLYALMLTAAAFGVDAAVALGAPQLYPTVFPVIQVVPVTVVVAAAIAILRHHLFDIDLLINRTLVYGAATVCLIAGYLLAVAWLGATFADPGNPLIALVATALVAVAFAPLRDRLQRLVNRLLYGHRDEPYRVLTTLGRRLEASLPADAVLPTVVETVSEALRLPYAAVQVGRADRFVIAAEHGSRPANGAGLLHIPLAHRGEEVGRLTLAGRGRRQQLSAADRRVLDDLAGQIGAAMHAVALSADLQRSREQLVVAREEERRRVGRDLHDGLGPQLASLAMKIEAARDLIKTQPQRAIDMLSDLLNQTDGAVADVRRVAYRLRPPVLDTLGLLAALRLHAADQRIRVEMDAPGQLPQLTAAVEVAAYHIALEALHNAASHAGATTCAVRVRHEHGALLLEVADDGRGLPEGYKPGVGLTSMRERAAELGGSCTVETAAAGGTLVRAVLPAASAVPAVPGGEA